MQESLPRITVVTPSYNQAQFLEQTILSVIGQGYPNLEYMLIDGGSNDGSIDIIKKYEQHFAYWQSEKDNGQSAAINVGFTKGTGDVFCWLNSDDLLMPGALLKIGRLFKDVTESAIIFGNCIHFFEKSEKTRGSDVVKSHNSFDLELTDYIIQPSSFWNKKALEKVGLINESYHFGMDWEWFIRAKRANVNFVAVPDYLSLYRIHDSHKSGSGSLKIRDEIVALYTLYKNEKIVNAYLRLHSFATKYRFIYNLIYTASHFKFDFISRALHLLFFSSISFNEYKQLIPR